MTKREIYNIGFKLIGVFCAATALAVFFTVTVSTVADMVYSKMSLAEPGLLYGRLLLCLQPIGYLIASFILIKKTDWCLSKLGLNTEQVGSEPPDELRSPRSGTE